MSNTRAKIVAAIECGELAVFDFGAEAHLDDAYPRTLEKAQHVWSGPTMLAFNNATSHHPAAYKALLAVWDAMDSGSVTGPAGFVRGVELAREQVRDIIRRRLEGIDE